MERRPEAKRLEQDFVDAHQQGSAAAAPPKGARCFDTDTPADESGDKQTLDVRPPFIEAKRGRAMRFAPRTLGQVSRDSFPCSKKGKGQSSLFLHGCAREKRESYKTACECVCMRILWFPLPFLQVFGYFFLQSVHFFSSFKKNDRVFCFRSQRGTVAPRLFKLIARNAWDVCV